MSAWWYFISRIRGEQIDLEMVQGASVWCLQRYLWFDEPPEFELSFWSVKFALRAERDHLANVSVGSLCLMCHRVNQTRHQLIRDFFFNCCTIAEKFIHDELLDTMTSISKLLGQEGHTVCADIRFLQVKITDPLIEVSSLLVLLFKLYIAWVRSMILKPININSDKLPLIFSLPIFLNHIV